MNDWEKKHPYTIEDVASSDLTEKIINLVGLTLDEKIEKVDAIEYCKDKWVSSSENLL